MYFSDVEALDIKETEAKFSFCLSILVPISGYYLFII